MTYYIYIENGQINGKGQARILNENFLNVEVEEEVYNNLEKYIWNGEELIINENYEQEQAQKEKERIAMISLTRGDVFRGLLQAKQVTRTQIRQMIETNESLTEIEREMALIDFDEALDFYRGVALIDAIGAQLDITPEQMTAFFETGDWHELQGE